ncbi:MAG: type IV secretory system conjugative DNA transfer family protein [Clostridia bacterium]|nr:type IV secretory system conjugative DNA transfer family protein [Clostridia bacterium]
MRNLYAKYETINQDLNQETRWATLEEIKRSTTHINLTDETYRTSGIPIVCDGHDAYVDGQDTHTLIFGATGSKKTRLFCMPVVNMYIKAGESFIVTDPKGEIFRKTSGMAKESGYKTIVLNFRDIGKGNMWNPLSLPQKKYHSGEQDEAVSLFNDFITSIMAKHQNTKDPFWNQQASALALANLLLLAESAEPEEVNVASLTALCSRSAIGHLQELYSRMDKNSIAAVNYSTTVSLPDRTLDCVLGELYSAIRIFNIQQNLTNMLSGSDFDVAMFGREKTAVYLIIPDEKSTFHFLASVFIKQAYEVLIAEAQREKNNELPVRVNFVLDEFCNMPTIPDMSAMISAARSRNMRFVIVAQSLHQLKGRYGEDAESIKGNCENRVFLTSKELDLLKETSELCGSYLDHNGRVRSLISVSELQRLDKTKGEALIMQGRNYPVISELPDIDSYEMFGGYDPIPLEEIEMPAASVFDIEEFTDQVVCEKRPAPFA